MPTESKYTTEDVASEVLRFGLYQKNHNIYLPETVSRPLTDKLSEPSDDLISYLNENRGLIFKELPIGYLKGISELVIGSQYANTNDGVSLLSYLDGKVTALEEVIQRLNFHNAQFLKISPKIRVKVLS